LSDFIRIPSNPVPKGGEVFDITTADKATLRAAIFPVENARGGVVLMGGRSEFIEKYFEVIEDLHQRGLSVATFDWRGQGLSSRLLPVSEKGHINDIGAYMADLRNFTEDIVRPRFDGPLFLMTHSMGGLPALMLLAGGYDAFARAVLCAPMTSFYPKVSQRVVVRTLAGTACTMGWSRVSVLGVKEYSLDFDGNVLTTDRRRHERFRELQAAAPNAIIGAPTYGWVNASIKAMDQIHKPGALAGITTPSLIISAENDQLIDASDHCDLAAAYDQIDCLTIKDALHEIMMERDALRDQYWKALDNFIAPALMAGAG